MKIWLKQFSQIFFDRVLCGFMGRQATDSPKPSGV